MHALFSGMVLLLLAGCADGGGLGSGGLPPLPTHEVHAAFQPGEVADTIQIQAIDQQPLRTVELVGPEGSATPASSIDVTRGPETRTGQFIQNDPFRGVLAGNGGLETFGANNPQANATLRGQTQLLMVASQAAISLPDPVAYRRNWRNYHLRLGFGPTPNNVVISEIAAPAPPPGS